MFTSKLYESFIEMEGYSDWKLDQLKAELRKRRVKVSGKKAELIERLKFLDSVGRGAAEPDAGKYQIHTFYRQDKTASH